MKQNPLLRCSRAIRICAAPFAALFAVSASAANVSWNGAADAVWSTGGNWVGGVAPVAADVAVFDAGSSANLTTALGADFSIAGLRITTPGGLITIGAGNLLTLGAGGIDMSAASQNLLIEALVALAANQSWNVANGRTLTANGIISGTNVNLNKIGLGDLILGGANTFTGITTIGGGTLTLNGSLNGTTGTDLTFAGTGTFHVSAASGVSQGMKVLRFSGGDGTVRSTNNSGTSTVSFTSRAARTAGATGNFTLINGTQGAGGTNNITIGGELTAQLLDRGLFYNGSQYAAYDAGSFMRGLIYGADTNAPATIPAGTTLGVNDVTKNVEISGDITAQTTASVNTIRVPGAFNIALDVSQTLSLNGILKSGGNASTISGGSGVATVSGTEMVMRTDAAGDSLTISSPFIANSSLTKSGAGTLLISGAVAYNTDATIAVNAGTLTFGGDVTGNANNRRLNKTGAGELILRGNNLLSPNVDGQNPAISVMGGGKLTIGAGLTFAAQTANSGRSGQQRSLIGQDFSGGSSGGNTMSIEGTGRLVVVNFSIGNGLASDGNNTLNISTPGSVTTPTMFVSGVTSSDLPDFGPTVLGGLSSNNTWNLTNGAYVLGAQVSPCISAVH